MKHALSRLLPGLAMLLLAGCQLPLAEYIPTPVPPTRTPLPRTATPIDAARCFYAEAEAAIPWAATAVEQALRAAGLDVLGVTAYGSGENFICPDAGTTSFLARTTNLDVRIGVEGPLDNTTRGELAGTVITALGSLGVDEVPNWQSGQVRLTLVTAEHEEEITFVGQQAQSLLEEGEGGSTLWTDLGGQPCADRSNAIPDDEAGARLEAYLQSSGAQGIQVQAVAFVIQCIDPASGEIQQQQAVNTNFTAQVQAPDLNDHATLGDQTALVLAAIAALPADSVPRPESASLELTYANSLQTRKQTISYRIAMQAYQAGLRGEALMDYLSKAY
ncbi:MAG: hypothetical protein VB089_02370 [Anaerolineaceae bacterium]|nr:hypothetical protein [Anaerolineaceae bacterium]